MISKNDVRTGKYPSLHLALWFLFPRASVIPASSQRINYIRSMTTITPCPTVTLYQLVTSAFPAGQWFPVNCANDTGFRRRVSVPLPRQMRFVSNRFYLVILLLASSDAVAAKVAFLSHCIILLTLFVRRWLKITRWCHDNFISLSLSLFLSPSLSLFVSVRR